MATAKQQENMLLTEHFTWPPISLIDDIINMINEVLYRCTTILDNELSSIDPAILGFTQDSSNSSEPNSMQVDGQEKRGLDAQAKLEIEEGVLKLETLVENAVDKNFDKLEIWTLRNVLCLPRGKEGEEELGRWIRLGHYEDLTIPNPSSNTPTITPESLYILRRKLQETQKLHAALLAEKTRNEAQIQKLRSLLQPPAPKRDPRSSTSPQKDTSTDAEAPFSFLMHSSGAQALGIQSISTSAVSGANGNARADTEQRTPLSTHTKFTTSQLPYLNSLLANLKPHLSTSALPLRDSGASAEIAKERREYIESQSKRILEQRGVDTRDGVEGAVEGQRVRAEEVRGLEGIAQALSKGEDDEGEAMDIS